MLLCTFLDMLYSRQSVGSSWCISCL